jgi:hypothetical protein
MKLTNRRPLCSILVVAVLMLAVGVQANDTLQIDKAFVGAKDSWRDVTMFLQDQIEQGALSVSIAQPFSSIGGDPAPGRVKNLIVDYHLNGQQRRLWLEEKYPVAFEVKLPSPDAETPGANPQVTALMDNIASSASRQSQPMSSHGSLLIYATACLSVAALVCAGLALFQLAEIRRALNQSRNPK